MSERQKRERWELWNRYQQERDRMRARHRGERAELKSPQSAAALRQRLEELNG